MIRIQIRKENFPGNNVEVSLWHGTVRIARAFGPNTNGWNLGKFNDLDSVQTALNLGNGKEISEEQALAFLKPKYRNIYSDIMKNPLAVRPLEKSFAITRMVEGRNVVLAIRKTKEEAESLVQKCNETKEKQIVN